MDATVGRLVAPIDPTDERVPVAVSGRRATTLSDGLQLGRKKRKIRAHFRDFSH
jgi:hypothetical protein